MEKSPDVWEDPPDIQLLMQRALAGDEQAWKAMMAHYGPAMGCHLLRYLHYTGARGERCRPPMIERTWQRMFRGALTPSASAPRHLANSGTEGFVDEGVPLHQCLKKKRKAIAQKS